MAPCVAFTLSLAAQPVAVPQRGLAPLGSPVGHAGAPGPGHQRLRRLCAVGLRAQAGDGAGGAGGVQEARAGAGQCGALGAAPQQPREHGHRHGQNVRQGAARAHWLPRSCSLFARSGPRVRRSRCPHLSALAALDQARLSPHAAWVDCWYACFCCAPRPLPGALHQGGVRGGQGARPRVLSRRRQPHVRAGAQAPGRERRPHGGRPGREVRAPALHAVSRAARLALWLCCSSSGSGGAHSCAGLEPGRRGSRRGATV